MSAFALAGKTICFAGTLTMPKADATAAAEKSGATVAIVPWRHKDTHKVDILIAGVGAGKMASDAAKKGIAVWTEDQFVAAFGGDAAKSTPAAPVASSSSSSSSGVAAGKKKAAPAAAVEEKEPTPKKGTKKKAPEPSASEASWEWRDDDGEWNSFASADAAMLEARWEKDGAEAVFSTVDFSFNAKHKTVYKLNYSAMTQTNVQTGVARAIRRSAGRAAAAPRLLVSGRWPWRRTEAAAAS